jgi:hypothetical protein
MYSMVESSDCGTGRRTPDANYLQCEGNSMVLSAAE